MPSTLILRASPYRKSWRCSFVNCAIGTSFGTTAPKIRPNHPSAL